MFSGVKIKLIKSPIKHRLIVVFCLLLIVSLFTLLMYEVKPRTSEAGTGENVSGFAWSSNIGWIKFNNCEDPSDEGTCSGQNFGVNLNAENQLKGYAWSNNVGWLRFDAPDLGGRPPAYFDPVSGKLRGWARFCAAAPTPATCGGGIGPGSGTGGWDGWVSLNCEDGGDCVAKPYSVSISGCDTFSGYAWGGDVVGWIKFNNCEDPSNPATCSGPDFGVSVLNLLLPPDPPTNVTASNFNYCEYSPHIKMTFYWDYSDCEGDPQNQDAFQIQVANDSGFGNIVYNSCNPANPSGINTCAAGYSSCGTNPCSYTPPQVDITGIEHDRTVADGDPYYLRILVNNGTSWSLPSDTTFEILSPHAYPNVAFDYTPGKPFIEEPVTFNSDPNTHCYLSGGNGKTVDPAGCLGYAWDFDGGIDTGTGTTKAPIVRFSVKDTYTVTLNVTDNDGYSCSDLQNVNISVRFEIPDWREIAP